MAQSNPAAVYIDNLRIKAKLPDTGDCLGGKRLIQLKKANL